MSFRKHFPHCWLAASLLLFAGLGLSFKAAAQSAVDGDWQGMLRFNGNQLHVALHIGGPDEALKASLDNIDQNAFGLVVNAITYQASTLTFVADSLHASYAAKLSADGGRLTGTLTQNGVTIPLDFERLSKPETGTKPEPGTKAEAGTKPDAGQDALSPSIDGAWSGSVTASGGQLPIVLHFSTVAGKLSATIDSPHQGAAGIAIPTVSRAGNTLHMALPAGDAAFDGSFSPDGQTLTGTWTQHGAALPLTLTRGTPGPQQK